MRHLRLTHPKQPRLRENQVIDACLDLLHTRGYKEHRLPCGKYRAPNGDWQQWYDAGTPDYAMMHPRYPGFYIEFKRPGAQPSKAQEMKHRELEAGWRFRVAVIDSVDVLIAFLREHEAVTNFFLKPMTRTEP
jgi:hypothetical protein